MTDQKRILIAGGGIAGPALALFLSRTGHWKCTIVERAPSLRDSGQQIDVSGEGSKVIKALGIDEAIRASTVKDDGLKFIGANEQVIASFPVSGLDERISPVREIEIMRSDLVQILYEHTKDNVEYIFGDTVTELRQDDDAVTVKFAKSSTEKRYDLVIAADGLRSYTRDLVFDKSNSELVSLNHYAGYFNIPWQESDGTWSQVRNETNGRCVVMRPNKKAGATGAYLSQVTNDSRRLPTMPLEEQKREIATIFSDVGWEAPRILRELAKEDASGFYLQESAQVKSKSLVNGRVALLGDAGYAPSPLTGQGTTLALVGAYILAGSILNHADNREALQQYENHVRPFVNNSQKLMPGIPWIINPQTAAGIKVLSNLVWAVSIGINSGFASAIGKVTAYLPSFGSQSPTLPEYSHLSVD